jgi:hypothetical protein
MTSLLNNRHMNNRQSCVWMSAALVFAISLSLDLAITTSSAEAFCRPSGQYAAGRPILSCTGRTKCRPTGRIKVVQSISYKVLSCPR